MTSLASLFSPLSFGGSFSLRNRVVMSALTRDRSVPTNVPNHINLEYYSQRAAGGAGLIVSEGTLIAQQGSEWPHAPGIWNGEQVRAWRNITEAVHKQGGKIFCQLWHLGRVSHPDAPEQIASGSPVYAPSAIAARGGKFRFLPGEPGYVTPTAVPDPRVIISQYKKAAVNAKSAGFDGVELHGANGYLVHQFLDNTSNKRKDEWGGSAENRSRFGLEVLKELVDVFGPGRVGIKLSPCGGYNDMGMSLKDTVETFSHFISRADAMLDLAYFCLVRYSAKFDTSFEKDENDEKLMRGVPHDVLAHYRPLIQRANFFLNADVTPPEAEELISKSEIDAAVFGWLWIGNPDLAARLQTGIPLNNEVNVKILYGSSIGSTEVERQREGYSDYPFATGALVPN